MGCAQSKPAVDDAPPSAVAKPQIGGGGSSGGGDVASPQKTVDAPGMAKPPGGPKASPAPAGGATANAAATSDASTSSSHSGGAAARRTSRGSSTPPRSGGDNGGSSDGGDGHVEGYSSGASTPADDGSLDGSQHRGARQINKLDASGHNPKQLLHSNSVLGLDKMIEDRKGEGDLKSNVVHIEVPFGKPIEEVYDGVHDGPVLGSGISGLVRLVSHKSTGVKYAVKCLDLGLVETEEGLQQLREEIYIMCQLDHPNIVRLEEVYESFSEIYLVQELCLGGELFDRLDEQPDYHYTEAQCARLVKQMLCSVRYIHSKGIIHRDLKLENFLFSSTNPDSELKMIDFGLSKHFKFGEVQHEAVGTPYTVAPEVIRGCYDERCDVWAIGVITFLLVSGDPPFGGCGGPEPLMQVRENILRGRFEFEPDEVWDNVSQQAKDFIRKLLVTDPNRRPTAREVQRSAWLREWANKAKRHEDKELNPNVVKALVNFKEYSDMRKLLCEVLSFTLLPDQIEDLRREFEKLDTDGSGEISLSGLKQVLISNAGAGSLGALTEEEVEDIFNAMRVRKTETRIHWHEFIAAGLSQCKVDDRNLKLAFDRLDSDHKGYITFENVTDLLGNDPSQSEDAMRRMWGDSMKACNCKHARITYEDFLLLMKGQTKPEVDLLGASSSSLVMDTLESSSSNLGLVGGLTSVGMGLDIVHETHEAGLSEEERTHVSHEAAKDDNLLVLPSGDVVARVDGSIVAAAAVTGVPPVSADVPASRGSFSSQGSASGSARGLLEQVTTLQQVRRLSNETEPTAPGVMFGRSAPELGGLSGGSLMMDDEDDIDEKISAAADKAMSGLMGSTGAANLTPPQSPRRGAVDFITPISQREKLDPGSLDGAPLGSGAPMLPGASPSDAGLPSLVRRRSRSVDDQDDARLAAGVGAEPGEQSPLFVPDVRRAILLPEHNHGQSEIENVIKDETKTPLVVNRQLYRAHRQLRLAVLEASKRFEEQQVARTKKMLDERSKKGGPHYGAGLTMRHGHAREMSSESIRKLMQQQQNQQQTAVDKASKRGGRGRRSRKKTISDMSGMLSSPPPGEMLMDPAQTESKEPPPSSEAAAAGDAEGIPAPEPVRRGETEPEPDSHGHHLLDPLRKPTTPGVFRKTVDPFAEFSGYRRMVGLEATSGARSVMPHGQTNFADAAAAPSGQGILTAAAASLAKGKKVSLSKKQDDFLNDTSVHSMRSSASDGNLKQLNEEAPSPQLSVDPEKPHNEGSDPSWPPPPPL